MDKNEAIIAFEKRKKQTARNLLQLQKALGNRGILGMKEVIVNLTREKL